MTSEAANRRRYPRVPSDALLEISHPAFGELKLKAKNASEGGFFVARGQSTQLPPVGTRVQVIIKRHTGALNEEPVTMEIVHTNDLGMGMKIISI